MSSRLCFLLSFGMAMLTIALSFASSEAFVVRAHSSSGRHRQINTGVVSSSLLPRYSTETTASDETEYEELEDAVIRIKPSAMNRLRELRAKQKDPSQTMVLRMGVRNGGCSGLSYVMDFSTEEDIQEDDEIDDYEKENIKCVVDAKSMLYLYGLELDYSEELIGGGFKFFNPNAEEACGCGSSFGV